MIIKSIQFKIDINNPHKNIERGINLIEKASETEVNLITMPEMWSVGLHPDITNSPFINETEKLLEKICLISKKNNVIILPGSLPLYENHKIFNVTFIVTPNGILENHYRKIHLFKVGGENKYTTSGKELMIYDSSFGKISPLICYDLRFPEIFRSLSMRGVSIFIVSAQWPKSREEHWITLLKARAIENQAFIIANNLCGNDGLLEFAGNTMVINPWGKIVNKIEYEEDILITNIDPYEVKEIRERFPFLRDSIWREQLINLSDSKKVD